MKRLPIKCGRSQGKPREVGWSSEPMGLSYGGIALSLPAGLEQERLSEHGCRPGLSVEDTEGQEPGQPALFLPLPPPWVFHRGALG